ncbi:MAG: type I methionyl aminopeptidase [Clostridia bacterium]|nr:type I methionyl aminopeptidase [Clostridia bacterium]
MISIKSKADIAAMQRAGEIVRDLLLLMEEKVKPGVTTRELDRIAYEFIIARKAAPSFLHYNGYPATICASVNEMVVHGIPGKYRLCEGDIISIDVGAVIDGFHADAARTFGVGTVSAEKQRLMDVTKQCFFDALAVCREGNRLSDIARAVQTLAEKNGYGVVRALTGHGIGKQMHEDPQVANFVTGGQGLRLRAGMAIAIEPMINQGTWQVRFLDDGWSVLTMDGKPSAHYENTVIITEGEPIVTTL